jgi:hypothetical protein|tara:strand:+ start:864 stop:2042 length:1179 start_codon:yes stop_codon:yes gene_type:complete
MKIKTLTQNQKISFKNEMPKYEVFLKEKLPHLATTSLSLYKRTLSYISTINKCNDKTVEETCIFLTSKLLTDTSLDCVIGDSNVSESNKNIRLSAFKNLVEIFRDEIKLKISPVAFNTTISMMGKAGGNIRKQILEIRKNKDMLSPSTMQTWEELTELNKIYLKKFNYIKNQYIKTNEVPDYVFLRDCLISNLYINNSFKLKNNEFNVILRNEYKSLYLHIGDNQPTSTSKNYIWIKLDSNDHKIIINKNKTTGGVKRKNLGDFIGHTSVYPQKNQKTFPLNKEIAKIIIFIKQVFNERSDKPFIKCNNRELNYTSSTWSKMLQRVFKKINPKLSSNLIRKIYQLKIDTTEDLSNQDKMLIYEMNDLHRDPKNLKDNKEDEENLVMTLDNYL